MGWVHLHWTVAVIVAVLVTSGSCSSGDDATNLEERLPQLVLDRVDWGDTAEGFQEFTVYEDTVQPCEGIYSWAVSAGADVADMQCIAERMRAWNRPTDETLPVFVVWSVARIFEDPAAAASFVDGELLAMERVAVGEVPELETFGLAMYDVPGLQDAIELVWEYENEDKSGEKAGPSRFGSIILFHVGRLELEAVSQGYDESAVRQASRHGALKLKEQASQLSEE